MRTDDKVLSRITELVELGEQVLSTRRSPSPGFITSDFVDVDLANRWLTSCLNIISRSFGEDSVHYMRLNSLFKDYPKWPDVQQAFGVLLAAKEDYEKGALFDIRKLIEADLFDDFLEQADYLLDAGYYQPAAVITGSILEDGLRKLCVSASISLPDRPKLDWMNAELAKRGIYNRLTQKKVTSLADLRNSAAHGKWDEFEKADVESMIRDTRTFMERFFG